MGTYGATSGLASAAECLSCPADYACPLRGGTAAVYVFGAANAFACGAGFVCLGGVKDVLPVPQDASPTGGKYCPAGHYCEQQTLGAVPCPAGFYQPNAGQSACLLCPAGSLCSTPGLLVPAPCPAGSYCPQGTLATASVGAVPCPAGTYSPFSGRQRPSDCIPCPGGQYCSGQGQTAPTGACSAGFHCPRSATEPTPTANVAIGDGIPGRCPAGHYCTSGVVARPCAPGTYSSSGLSACSPCAAGHYCPSYAVTDLDLPTLVCAAGYYCGLGATVPNPSDGTTGGICPTGRYCPSGSAAALPCPDGTYEPRTGSSSCPPCPAGFYCAAGSRTACAGGYCPQAVSAPLPCPEGMHDNGALQLTAAAQCAYCPVGEYCSGGKVRAGCDAGYYCDFGAALASQGAAASSDTAAGGVQYPSKKCPRGHYCLAAAQYPTRCEAGKYTSQEGSAGASDCQACPAGAYCRAKDNTALPCPKGHWCWAGADAPSPCWPGSYNNLIGQSDSTACITCPPGSFCDSPGTADWAAHLCPAGHYCPVAGLAPPDAPAPCRAGTYLGARGASSASDCLLCPPGFSCAAGSSEPLPCRNGTFCPAGAARATECGPGEYCPALASAPSPSPPAYFQPAKASDLYEACPNGTYCGPGAVAPAPCPAGYFGTSRLDNADFASGCSACDPGSYAIAGENSCRPCPPGYVCLGASASSATGGRRLALARLTGSRALQAD